MTYSKRTVFGWIMIIIISLIPVALWFSSSPDASEFSSYGEITHNLGELFGLIGMTMFALTFVLSTRIKWIEDVFGGLDKVYIVHAILGGGALIAILAHPIFLVLKFIPAELNLAAEYLLPSSYWSINYGIIALVGMIILIFITLYTKMKYHTWKFTHEFLGLMFIFAVLHIFLVRNTISNDNIFDGYYIYAGIVSFIGLASFSYSLFLKNRIIKNAVYKVSSIKAKGDLFEIEMSPEHKPLNYKSGQFVFVRFYNQKLSKEDHPFSIASSSNSPNIRIIVKKLGDYTSKLENLNVGDKVLVEGPYGRFNFRLYKSSDQVWIAAGIGITPFLGMAHDLLINKGLEHKVTLFYSVKFESDLIDYNFLSTVASENKKFKFLPWTSSNRGRIDVNKMKEFIGSVEGKEFFLCGPSVFKEELIKDLMRNGVKKSQIHEEAFDFR